MIAAASRCLAARARPESAHGTPPAARARSPSPRAGRAACARCETTTARSPLASPEWTPSVSTSTVERAAGETAQRRRRPQPLVVAAARIEPDDEVDASHPRREQLEIRRQVVAAALLARFDHADAARVRDALRLQARRSPRATRTPRSRRRRRRARRACRPRSAAPRARSPCASPSSPAACRDVRRAATVAIAGAGDIEKSSGVRPGRRTISSASPRTGCRAHPGFGEADHALDVAVRFPLRIEMRRLRRNADVLDQLRDDRFGPVR